MRFIKTTLCLSVLLALSACGEKDTVESHLNKAKTYISANQVNESIIALKNAIRIDTKNSQARFLLGEVYLNLGDGASAAKELERAKSLGFAHKKLLPLLARSYILTESDADVIGLHEDASKLPIEQRSHYLAYQTLAALRTENVELAKESVKTALSISEKSMGSMLANAYLQLFESNNKEAEALVNAILVIDPNQVDALMLLGQIATVARNFVLAGESYKKYLALQPRSGVVQLLLADALLRAENYVEAEEYADNILAHMSNQPFANYIKAMVRFHAKDFVKSSEHAEAALSANFNQMNLKLVAGASAFYLKNWEQATYHLKGIVKHLSKEHSANRMLAVSQLELGLISEISDTLDGFSYGDNSEQNAEFLASVSFKLLELGAVDEAKKLIEQSDGLETNNAKTHARQGVLKLMMNDPSGLDDLKDAIKLDPDLIEAELALAFSALQSGEIEQAQTIAMSWREKYPEKSGGLNLLSSIAMKQKDYAKAESLLTESLQLEPDNIFALLQQLRIARLQENETLSNSRADYLVTVYPNNNQVLRLYFGTYRNDAAIEKLVAAYELNKKDTQKAILLAEAYLNLEKIESAEILLKSIESEAKLPKRYWQLTVLIARQKKEFTLMQSVLEKWFEINPYHIEPVVLLADIYANKRNYELALTTVKRGLKIHKNSLILELVYIQLLLNNNKIEEAKELYSILAVKDINESLKDGLQGRIFLLEGNFVQAIPKLESLYKSNKNEQNSFYLAGAYVGNNEESKAVSLLSDFLVENPGNTRVKARLAGFYLANEEDKDKAIDYYTDVVKSESKNVIVNNNLAWLHLEKGNNDLAFKYAKAAFDIAPQVPNVLDTYSQVLLKTGDNKAALKYSSEASDLTKGKDIDIRLNYIEALIANDHLSKAKYLLESIVTTTEVQKAKKSGLLMKL